MQPEDFELYCANLECGNTVVHSGVFTHAARKEHRRLQYTGILQLPGDVVAHQYLCPVCSTKRLFANRGDGLEEIPHAAIVKVQRVSAIASAIGEVLDAGREEHKKELEALKDKPVRRFWAKLWHGLTG